MGFAEALVFEDKAISSLAQTEEQQESEAIECPEKVLKSIQSNKVDELEELLKQDATLRDCRAVFILKYTGEKIDGTALHYAAEKNLAEVSEVLLRTGFDPNGLATVRAKAMTWNTNSTPLMVASHFGSVEVVKVLLKQPTIEVNAQDAAGWTPLIYSAVANTVEVAQLLLSQREIDVNAQRKDGYTALMNSLYFKHDKVTDMLLNNGPKFGLDLNVQTNDGYTILRIALTWYRHEVVRRLCKAPGMDVNLPDKSKITPLMYAASSNRLEGLNILLAADRINVDMQDEDGLTALMMAVNVHDVEALTESNLLKMSTLSLTDKAGRTALHHAIMARKVTVPEVEGFTKVKIMDILLKQCSHSSPDTCKEVMNTVAKDNLTALQLATKVGLIRIVKALLEKGAAVSHKDQGKTSALQLALSAGRFFITKMLAEKGASVDLDIAPDDEEGRRLSVWFAVRFSNADLLEQFARDAKNWTELWRRPESCVGDLEGLCEGQLMTHAANADTVHQLLDWQDRFDKKSPDVSEADRAKYDPGLSPESKQEVAHALKEVWIAGNSKTAFALLARGAGELLEAEHLDQIKARKPIFEAPSLDPRAQSSILLSQSLIKAWNRLHWSAFSCDISALSLALKYPTEELVTFLDSRAEEGDSSFVFKTPFEIAQMNQETCIRSFGIFQVLQQPWQRQNAWRNFVGHLAAINCTGALALQLFFLRLQTLQKRGWMFMSVVPLILLLTGLLLVLFESKPTRGSVTMKEVQMAVGWSATVGGTVLLLLAWTTFASTYLTLRLQHIKKKGNDKMDRFWERLNCSLAWLLLFAIVLKDILMQQAGIRLRPSDMLAGLAHALACTCPLCTSFPTWISLLLRLAPGVCVTVVMVEQSIKSSSFNLPAPPALLLVATCLASAWADLPGAVTSVVTRVRGPSEIEMVDKQAKNEKFTANKLILGRAAIAAHGIDHALGLTHHQISAGLHDPIGAMRQEVLATGDQNDIENFTYIVEGTSGRPSDYPTAVSRALETGIYHGGTLGPDDFDTGHDGLTLDDWMQVQEVVLANLTKAEFVAVRFYTSSSFGKINGPLRKEVRPHPWAMVVYLLDRGIKKLRSVQAQVDAHSFAGQQILWRGMKNLEVDIKHFAHVGGTEMAPMSTTTNEEVARHYASSKVPLVFKYVVGGLKTGVSIQFLSLYPKEEEFLYAPLTFLSLKSHYEDDGTTILVVEPVMS